ncbi:MAG TPA: hypothetical protein VEA36_02545 [Candidatus Paceibacterota bacterium]|nr:hypothetical protein [Candidatus Paceibacterota bacterium]
MTRGRTIAICRELLAAYQSGKLGQTVMPEDSNPGFDTSEPEARLSYFTLPMALNYQRDSYRLWEGALKTYQDPETQFVFSVAELSTRSEDDVRAALMKYKVALQPNKHVQTWRTIARTVHERWGSFAGLMAASDHDFLKLRQLVQVEHKKEFPYLSGPKIFNYWAFILSTYGGVALANRSFIDIAPDTHITQCSVRLEVITAEEAITLSRDELSERWRALLAGSGIDPIDMHPPLWFWSRNGFLFEER